MAQEITQVVLSSTEAIGAATASLRLDSVSRLGWRHLIQAEVVSTATQLPAVPTAGSLAVRGKILGASTYQLLGNINLLNPQLIIFEGFYDSLEAQSIGLDADKTWKLFVVSGK